MCKFRFLNIVIFLALSAAVHAQSYKVLYNFGSKSGDPTNPVNSGTIAQSHGGYMLSTTDNHGTDGLGTAFRITAQGTLTVLHHFTGADGQAPVGGLTLATDGNFYGTTQSGGAHGYGTIFKLTPQGILTRLHSFTGGADGGSPTAAPIQSFGGDLYGTTSGPGESDGSVYKITKSGKFTLLHSFAGKDGSRPYAPLIQGSDGYFYGTTASGGLYTHGTIFRISSVGHFKVLFNFDDTNGSSPVAPLIQARDGNFYGVTFGGGFTGFGVVFKMAPSHKVTVLHTFNVDNDGGQPRGGLAEASDGNFYGATIEGGSWNLGTIFRITPAGAFTVLHNFDINTGDGAYPQTTLLQHTNGILYGDTEVFGTAGYGTFYSLDLGLPPFVTFLPGGGRAGARVQILGQGFTGTTAVSFNGVPADFTVSFSTYLTAIVPPGATTGFITVTTPSGTLNSNEKFIVWP